MFLISYNSDSYNYRISYATILQHIEEIKAPFIPRLKPVKLVWAFWRGICKWQQSSGSVDEKFPYLYLNCIEVMPEDDIIIVVDGGGAKKGAIDWLRRTAEEKKYITDKNSLKNISVMSLSEFLVWANKTFR